MFERISEPDWKIFKPLRATAIERFWKRALDDVTRIANEGGKTSQERCGAIHDLIKKNDKEAETVFDFLRRSTAVMQIAGLRHHELITDEEFSRFSVETRDVVNRILGV